MHDYCIYPSAMFSLSSIYFSCYYPLDATPDYKEITAKANVSRSTTSNMAKQILSLLGISVDNENRCLIYKGTPYPYKACMPDIYYLCLTPLDKTCIESILQEHPDEAGKLNALLNCLGYIATDTEGKWKLTYMGTDLMSLLSAIETDVM